MEIIKDRGITIAYGPAGSGKTTFAIHQVINKLKLGKKVMYIDTERTLSIDRLKQIGGKDINLDNLFVLKVANFKDQQIKINELNNMKNNFGLIVFDSLNNHYRSLTNSKPDLAHRMLINQLNTIKKLSEITPILILNQVYANPATNEIKMVGHEIQSRYADELIELKMSPYNPSGPKKLIFKSSNKEVVYDIVKEGIRVI
ncbi:MAG: AAA family ATPase [Candidatus Nanoarchaeia archaeon]|nr:AAA family ATPase [Candidatus Nanoarchaeia archaeon]MDD5587816.1 AAA family ATPase [Candidatus Nanoarchaeia archaeon]